MISSCARNWGVSIVNNENFSRYGLGKKSLISFLVQLDEKRLVWPPFFKNRTSKSKRKGKKNGLFTLFLSYSLTICCSCNYTPADGRNV